MSNLHAGDAVEVNQVWAGSSRALGDPLRDWIGGYELVRIVGKNAVVRGTRGVFAGSESRWPLASVRKARGSRGRSSGFSEAPRAPRDKVEAARFSNLPPHARLRAPIEIFDLSVYTWHECKCGHAACVVNEAAAAACPAANVRYIAMAFIGKQTKPLWYYGYKTEKARDERIAQEIKNRRGVSKIKADRAAERKAPPTSSLAPGDILYASWGYDQTNIEFYEVVAVRGTAIDLREIGTKILKPGNGSDLVGPDRTVNLGTLKSKRIVRSHSGDPVVNIGSSRGHARRWDGKPLHQTSSGAGHVGGRAGRSAGRGKIEVVVRKISTDHFQIHAHKYEGSGEGPEHVGGMDVYGRGSEASRRARAIAKDLGREYPTYAVAVVVAGGAGSAGHVGGSTDKAAMRAYAEDIAARIRRAGYSVHVRDDGHWFTVFVDERLTKANLGNVTVYASGKHSVYGEYASIIERVLREGT